MGEQWSLRGAGAQEEEVMSILLGSSLITEMTVEEREKLLRYLIASYFQSPADECRLPHPDRVRPASCP